MQRTKLTLALLAGTIALPAFADGELNLYSSRHYDTDERLYTDFEDMTGITINRIEGNADELIARMAAEGLSSPADVLLTVDTTRLERAHDMGLLQSIDSDILEERIPSNLQDVDNQWFGFSQRARIIFYDAAEVTDPPQTYLELADPAYEGMICHRSSTNVYSQTLLSAVIEHHGEEAATEWAQGFVNNFARDPQGGDTDQLRGIVSGECDIAISNTYYFARALRRAVDGLDAAALDGMGWVFPMMTETEGAHVNLSGGGVAVNAPNRDNAILFLEYLASDSAQRYFADGNDEYPTVPGLSLSDSVASLGASVEDFDTVDLSAVAQNLEAAQRIFATVGWE